MSYGPRISPTCGRLLYLCTGIGDPFGLPEEMKPALQLVGAPVVYSEVTGAGHDLKSGKFDVQRLVVQPLLQLLVRN